MDALRCPACGAAARAGSQWCSLCYQDLRPPATAVATSATQLLEVFPADVHPDVSPAADPPRRPGPRAVIVGARDAESEVGTGDRVRPRPVGAADQLRWPCTCGNEVSFDQRICSVCGSPFLADLPGTGSGKHRTGGAQRAFGSRWAGSRTFRFVVAGVVGLLIAVLLPVLLTFFG